VATFFVLRQLPGVTRDQYAAAQQAAMAAASQSSAEGHVVRYLRGFFLPSAGRAICMFDADSAADVAMVNQHAGVPFTEVLEAIEMRPGRAMADPPRDSPELPRRTLP
jgi:hypothetical protein